MRPCVRKSGRNCRNATGRAREKTSESRRNGGASAEMRIVAGKLRGRTLKGPNSNSIRPTSDRLRESVFNILVHGLGDPITDARVLDLFAGTGALGIEA